MSERYEAVIGLEVHAELKTRTKIFCSCPTTFGAEPNTCVCPVCMGMPGALPVLGKEAVTLAVRAGLALHCEIHRKSWFDRKNYYYPDLPKGYQITQYEQPICTGGYVPIVVDGEEKRIRLTRIHMEEDAGKLIHRGESTLIDYNRCGVPLIEIVSEPDMRSPEEAKAYLNALRRILTYMGVSDCRMNEGSLRCDVNVSVRKRGETAFGVKCEIKNLNSVNYVGRALEDEIARQIRLCEAGEPIEPETRRYDEDSGHTVRMRRKETAVDYRYFTEANLPPLILTESDLEEQKRQIPKMPEEEAAVLTAEGIKPEDAQLLTQSLAILEYYRRCAAKTAYPNLCVNLFIGEVLPKIAEETGEIREEFRQKDWIAPEYLGEIADLFGSGKIVSGAAKQLVVMAAERQESPRKLAEEERMMKITDAAVLRPMAKRAIEANPRAASDYLRGKTAAVRQLVGAVMRESSGRADPIAAERLLTEELDRRKTSE